MQQRRKILFLIISILLVLGIIFWWMMRGQKMMDADVTASNGSHYAMQLPGDMLPAHFNDSAASLEYESENRELSIEVVSDSKAKIISFGLDYDLDTYMKIATRQIDPQGLYVNKSITINGLKSLQTEITQKNKKNQNIHYKLTCIETPRYFYMISIYTTDQHFESNRNDMEKMVNSFKEAGE
jgi:hypothetical protein